MSKVVTVLLFNVVIQRELVTGVSKEIWPWELPIYELKFGEGSCEQTGSREVERVLPDAEDEYGRLHACSGVDAETKQSWVDQTFGRGKAGVRELQKHIDAAIVKPHRKKKAAAKKPDVKKDPGSKPATQVEESRDPLA